MSILNNINIDNNISYGTVIVSNRYKAIRKTKKRKRYFLKRLCIIIELNMKQGESVNDELLYGVNIK